MKKFISFALASALLTAPFVSRADIVITNATVATTWSDSFGIGLFGQRQILIILGYCVNYHPQHFVSPRDHSRSGGSNIGQAQGLMPEYGIPDMGATYGVTNAINFFYVSGNAPINSNNIYTNFVQMLQYPTNSYNKNVVLTNDWTQANAANLFKSYVIGDIPPRGGNTFARDYSYGARSAAIAAGVPFVDSFSNMIAVTTNNDFDPTILWFPNTNDINHLAQFDHPNNNDQFIWAFTTLLSLGVDTNTFTAIIDGAAISVSSTNHCTVTGLTGNTSSFTFIFHADRMAPGFYVPDGTTTNDCRRAIPLYPALGNAFCEVLRVTNLPAGNYQVVEDGTYTNILSSSQLASGWNRFTNYNNALWAQKMAVLYLMCDLRDVLHTDNSTDAHPGNNLLLENEESFARTIWPTNAVGVDGYILKMQPQVSLLFTKDIAIHSATQQTNHTFTITLQNQSASANWQVGTFHWGQ